jgi:hypothetical protein
MAGRYAQPSEGMVRGAARVEVVQIRLRARRSRGAGVIGGCSRAVVAREGGRRRARSKRDVVVLLGMAGQWGKASTVHFEGVLELSDRGEEEVSMADWTSEGGEALVGGGEQLGVLCDEKLDHEEGRGIEEGQRIGER